MKLTYAIQLSLIFGLLGYIFSKRSWIKFLDKLSPTQGLVVYYAIIYFSVYILSLTGLVIGNSRISNPVHTLGVVLILFAYFVIFNWESAYIDIVTRNGYNTKETSNVYLQSEDGATFDFFYRNLKNAEYARIFTFIVTPIVLTFIGSLMITEKVNLGLF